MSRPLRKVKTRKSLERSLGITDNSPRRRLNTTHGVTVPKVLMDKRKLVCRGSFWHGQYWRGTPLRHMVWRDWTDEIDHHARRNYKHTKPVADPDGGGALVWTIQLTAQATCITSTW